MVADPAVRADPVPFIEEMRTRGRIVKSRAGYLTVDHEVAHELLRSDDFRVTEIGANLARPLVWVKKKTDTGLLHPLEPPSLLSVEPPEHTRYRKLVSSVFTPRAIAALRAVSKRPPRCCSTTSPTSPAPSTSSSATAHSCRSRSSATCFGVPDEDRPQILMFGELGAPSLDIGLSWQQYLQVHRGIVGFNEWWADHLQQLRRNPGDDLLSQLTQAADEGGRSTTANFRQRRVWSLPPASRLRSTCWATG